MPLDIKLTPMDGFLSVKAVGRATLQDMFDMISLIAAEVSRTGDRRVLVDQTEIEEEFRFTDHFAIGERVVTICGNLEKAASVVRGERRTGTSEKVAQKKGVQLRVFVSCDEALAWLNAA